MNSKRSYIDTINTGRQRRANASFDDLDRTLASMEGRLDARGSRMAAPRQERLYAEDRWPARDHGGAEQARGGGHQQADLKHLAQELERTRRQEDSLSSVSRIAGELKTMREELRQQMNAGLRREFDTLRKDIQNIYQNMPSFSGSELGAEFERLSDAVRTLSERGDDRSVNMLRLELEQVKGALDSLAREDTLQTVDRRWDDFDRRWSSLEQKLDAGGIDRPEYESLNNRLEQISASVGSLPESLSLTSLDERLRTLGASVDQFARQYAERMPEAFGLIEQRLDEISRAVASSGAAMQAPAFDPQPMERIEARVTSLARQIDELMEEQGSGEVLGRIHMLHQRVDELAHRTEIPEAIVARLADQISHISDRLDHNRGGQVDLDAVFTGLEDRFVRLSQVLEQRHGDAIEQGHQLFRDLEQRLDEVARRIDTRDGAGSGSAPLLDAIDQRFAELTERLAQGSPGGDRQAIEGLENRLQDISSRLEQSSQNAGMDPEVMRGLESQIQALSAHLQRPGQSLPEFEDIAPRLEHIEQSLSSSREAILEAARKAAQDAVQSMGRDRDPAMVDGLATELKSLEDLTRRSDERNAKTFEAIHDTLLKIVDRLGSLEQGGPYKQAPAAAAAMPAAADDDGMFAYRGHGSGTAPRSPAEAAAAAASHALGKTMQDEAEDASPGRKSVLSSLTRAFRKDRDPAAADLPAARETIEPPSLGMDAPLDPQLANQPLEPGSGAPDLNAIIRRVRDEREGNPSAGPAAGTASAKSDFIAAARRAAQAAAAEAQQTKGGGETPSGGGKLKIGGMFKPRRRTMMLAATALIVVLGGWQLSNAFLGGGNDRGRVAAKMEPTASETPTLKAEALPPVETAEPIVVAEAPVVGSERPMRVVDRPAEVQDDEIVVEEPLDLAAAPANGFDPVEQDGAAETDAPVMAALPDTQPSAAMMDGDVMTSIDAAEIPADAGPVALREAAQDGDPKAMFEIASRYAEGRGVEADPEAAAAWYERAAELGYAPAQYRVGNLYEKGTGVGQDLTSAAKWYELAARQGNASAMHNLAVLNAMGAGGEPDNDQAARWFLEAAELGVTDSQYNLGILTAKGAGVPQSLEESYKWFALVAKTGDKDAASKRDEIAKALDAGQLEKARAATELWKARTPITEANVVDIPDEWTESQGQTAAIDMKEAVRNIQDILNKNGYDAGPADGLMGDRTRRAIMAFQGDNDMPANGEVTEELVRALLARR